MTKEKVKPYLDYCRFRKELDEKTLKAYRIDLRQYFDFVVCDEPGKGEIERYITELHKKYKQKTVKRKIASSFTEQSIRNMIKKYTRLAGIERNITPHMFRHSFATYLIEAGVDISCLQQILGHSSIKTTQIYIYVAAEKQTEILRTRHPRNKMKIGQAAQRRIIQMCHKSDRQENGGLFGV